MRLRVVAGGVPHDLVVPAGVPVVEVAAELASSLLGPTAAATRLLRSDGSLLRPALTLEEHGVRDGDVVTLAPASEPTVHDAVDDPVEAVVRAADASPVVGGLPRWGAVGALAVVVVVAVVAARATPSAALALVLGGLVASALLVTGTLVVRHGQDLATGLVALGAGTVVGGALVLSGPWAGGSWWWVGATVLLMCPAAALAATGPRGAAWSVAPAAAGALTAAGAAATAVALPVQPVVIVLLVVAVLLARAVPWVAASAVGVERSVAVARAGVRGPAAPGGVDLGGVAATLDRTRRVARSGVWGLGAGAVLLAVPGVVLHASTGPLGPGHVLVLDLALVLLGSAGRSAEPGLRRAAGATGTGLLVLGLVAGLRAAPSAAPVVVALAGCGAGLVLGPTLTGRRPPGAPVRLLGVLDAVVLAVVLPVLAADLGLLPGPWGAW